MGSLTGWRSRPEVLPSDTDRRRWSASWAGRNRSGRAPAEPCPFEIDSITATARPRIRHLEDSGFYRREEQGWGSFYDRPRLERLPAAFPRQLLRQLRGVSTTTDGSIRMGSCSPAIFLDGMQMGKVNLDDVVDPATIQGIEIYDLPNTVPVEFRRGRTCGAVVLWTQPRP